MKWFVIVISTLLLSSAPADGQSSYAGEEHRSIKALSAADIESLMSGRGMGFAKTAELNRYPGPRHVLDLADHLELTPVQRTSTQALFEEMEENAIALGETLLAAEASLEKSFQDGSIDADGLQSALLEIGEIRARLRFVHLEAHIRQTELMSADQVSAYIEARGYSEESHDSAEHQALHH